MVARAKKYALVFIMLPFLLLVLILSSCDKNGSGVERPNFLIIFVDDLGYGDLGCYGHPTIKTPNIDAMALGGMRLTQFYMAASICSPSRAGLLTGRLPVRSGIYGKRSVFFPDNAGGLQPAEITIAKVLKSANYHTACIGKWHLGHLPEYMPTSHGFDHFYGIPYSNDMRPESNWDYASENFPPLMLMDGLTELEVITDQSELTNQFTENAIEFMKKHIDNSFFVYLPYSAPHTPLHVPEDQQNSKRGLYGDVVKNIDDNVGKLMDFLRKNGLEKNTFVLFTSDNGPWGWAGLDGGSAGLLSGKKGSMMEGGFRVPAIAYMPGMIPANVSCDAIGTALDLFPTILSMASVDHDDSHVLDGVDISTTFSDCESVQNQVFYYRQDELVAFRQDEWKIFVRDPNPWNDDVTEADLPLLYNVEYDPSEKFNVANDHPNVVDRLKQAVKMHMELVEIAPSQLEEILPAFKANYDEYNNRN